MNNLVEKSHDPNQKAVREYVRSYFPKNSLTTDPAVLGVHLAETLRNYVGVSEEALSPFDLQLKIGAEGKPSIGYIKAVADELCATQKMFQIAQLHKLSKDAYVAKKICGYYFLACITVMIIDRYRCDYNQISMGDFQTDFLSLVSGIPFVLPAKTALNHKYLSVKAQIAELARPAMVQCWEREALQAGFKQVSVVVDGATRNGELKIVVEQALSSAVWKSPGDEIVRIEAQPNSKLLGKTSVALVVTQRKQEKPPKLPELPKQPQEPGSDDIPLPRCRTATSPKI